MIKCSLFTWSAFLRFLSQCQCLVVFSTANLTFLYTLFSKMVWIFEIIGSILPRTRSACATLMCLTFLSLQGVQSVWKILINAHPVLFRNYVVGIADVMMIYCRYHCLWRIARCFQIRFHHRPNSFGFCMRLSFQGKW